MAAALVAASGWAIAMPPVASRLVPRRRARDFLIILLSYPKTVMAS
jgi:hypothetical protein